jgi:protein Tex
MASTVTIDLRHVARGLDFPVRQVQAVVELLDDGNTVPFITRYRKDQTGGLDEEQIRDIQDRLAKMRLLADRKQTILRSIEAQGKLTEKLERQILSATTTKRLEDLYLPYKPKKQTLATLARTRGLEELATEILEAAPTANDLDARSRDFANPDRQVPSGADALLGAGHILAEQFSERADLRHRLREILQKTGKLVTTQIAPDPAPEPVAPEAAKSNEPKPAGETAPATPPSEDAKPAVENSDSESATTAVETAAETKPAIEVTETAPPAVADDTSPSAPRKIETPPAAVAEAVPVVVPSEKVPEAVADRSVNTGDGGVAIESPSPAVEGQAASILESPAAAETPAIVTAAVESPAADAPPADARAPAAPAAARKGRDREQAKAKKENKKDAKKKKLEERRVKAFRDYFNYAEDIKKIPPHRVLAINRAERAKILRVKIECDLEGMSAAIDEILVPPGHPHADYLRGCARDALNRLILPALEREARRELTDRAETHAVGVFARNLRNLLLQPPIHNRRVLAVDPGFKSGCKLAALDQFGNMLGHDVIYLIGSKPGRKEEAKQKAMEIIHKHELSVVAIGNGTACRETEDFFAELLSNELKDQGVAYVIVNEAGASVYSTSQLGREEFPEYDATLRGAVSIGRRLLDPLSELVKIDAANIGVGLYQHDVKAKHLEFSLDEVVESCVNYVGVDVNTASPALLRYVSGLNQLTARRVYEYRREHGPFRSREQLRAVPGFGDATFVQAAGFLKISHGENPLDATWIHPESYAIATRVLEKFGGKPSDLNEKETAAALAQRMAAVDVEVLTKDIVASLPEIAAPGDAIEPAAATPVADAATGLEPVEQPPAEIAAPDHAAEAVAMESAAAVSAPAGGAESKAESSRRERRNAVGTLTLRDIIAQLARPGRDPREDLPAPVFKQGVLKLEDLAAGMELTGTVLNVVDFGCFVDIGMHDSGLVHVSRLADRFIRDPHEVVAVGDIVKVWVMEVDKERRRVSLTMVRPGSERSRRPARGEGDGSAASGRDQAAGQPSRQSQSDGQGRQGDRSQGGRSQGGRSQGDRSQGGRPQGGRPQGGRPQGRPQHAGDGQQGTGQQGAGPGGSGPQGDAQRDAGPGGRPRDVRRGGYGGPPRKPRPQGPGQSRPPLEFKPAPKPLIPISDGMKKGKEPMRTFGDLMQFFEAKTDEKKPQKSKSNKPSPSPPHAAEQGVAAEQPTATDASVLAAEESAVAIDRQAVDANVAASPPPTGEVGNSTPTSQDGFSPNPQSPPPDEG